MICQVFSITLFTCYVAGGARETFSSHFPHDFSRDRPTPRSLSKPPFKERVPPTSGGVGHEKWRSSAKVCNLLEFKLDCSPSTKISFIVDRIIDRHGQLGSGSQIKLVSRVRVLYGFLKITCFEAFLVFYQDFYS